MEEARPKGYTVHLEAFEGPMDLLMHLIEKDKIDIYDIPIAKLTEQYLDYLERMQSLDLEIASEFVQMAAHLLYLKTRTLLTTEEEVSELELDHVMVIESGDGKIARTIIENSGRADPDRCFLCAAQ